uniref:RNA-directed RNA polymerase n=1 Tax=Neotermes castaneus sobeli-like virus 2 TaxID=3133515 RepID=A0AAT9JFW8_9VIRU
MPGPTGQIWTELDQARGYHVGSATQTLWNPYNLPEQLGKGYQWPQTDAAAVLDSLRFHSERRQLAASYVQEPTEEERALTHQIFYERHRIKYPVPSYDLRSEEGHKWFLECVVSLNFKASPGLGFFRQYATVGDALGWNGAICTQNLELLKNIVMSKLQALLTGGEADDLRTFIKNEPHKHSKVMTKSWRLIMVMSLEDQMVDRILMRTWQRVEERNVLKIPGKTGWTPIPSGYRQFNADFPGPVLATDCSSFDWTFPSWVATDLLDLRLSMMVRSDPIYESMVRARWAQVLRDAVLQVPSGRRFRQCGWGLMKSGWLRTIAENSSAQVLINALAWVRCARPISEFPTIWTMGDDVIMDWSTNLSSTRFEEQLTTTGILVKQSTMAREFAGFEIEGRCVTPLYAEKHAFSLKYVSFDQKAELSEAYMRLYALAKPGLRDVIDYYLAPCSPVTWQCCQLWARG